MHLLRYGTRSPIITRVIYGHLVAFCMRWRCWSLHLGLIRQMHCSKKSWSASIKKLDCLTRKSWLVLLRSWWPMARRIDRMSRNCCAILRCWTWKVVFRWKRKMSWSEPSSFLPTWRSLTINCQDLNTSPRTKPQKRSLWKPVRWNPTNQQQNYLFLLWNASPHKKQS